MMAVDSTVHSNSSDPEKIGVYETENGASPVKELVEQEPVDPVAVKKLIRKCDIRVVPPLFILFLLAFLDRTNIGNANVQGLSAGLGLSGPQYNIALFIFFIPYILLEVPSNIILKKIAPSTWLSSIMVLWGITTIFQGVVNDFGGLVGLRFLLGIFEAGLFPGCIYLISMYYERYQLQWRLTLFFSASIVAGAFGGLFAYALANMDGIAGYAGWRWIFIMEGLLTVVIGAASKFWIVDWPEKAKFLNDEERELLARILRNDGGEARMDRLDKKSLKRALFDWKIWVGTFMYMGVVNTGYATSFFIPTIINQLGYSAAASQVRSIPIFVVACVAALLTAWFTDKLRHRYSFIILGLTIAVIGYVILLNADKVSVEVRYMACFFITMGGYIAQPVTIAWLSNQMAGHYKRSIAAGIQIGIGNCGGLVASNIFLKAEAPRYPTGFGTSLGLIVFCGIMSTVFFFALRHENKMRDMGKRDHRYNEDPSELSNMGDDHPSFRFST